MESGMIQHKPLSQRLQKYKDSIECVQYTTGEGRDSSRATTSRMYYNLSAQPTYKKKRQLLDKGLS